MDKPRISSKLVGKIIFLINLGFLISSFGYIYRHRPPKRMFDTVDISEVLEIIMT